MSKGKDKHKKQGARHEGQLEEAEQHFEEVIELPISDSLDLHTFHPREVKDLVNAWLDEVWARGFSEVRIIHGKGTGQLRERVHSVLRKHPAVERFELGAHGRGSWGATVAWLRVKQQ